MNRDVILLLAGAAIALVSSIITSVTQHLLSLRIEKMKRIWEKREKESQELRQRLTEGSQIQMGAVERKLRQAREDSIGEALSNVSANINSPEELYEAMKVLQDIYANKIKEEDKPQEKK